MRKYGIREELNDRGKSARRSIAMSDEKFIISNSSVLRKARLAVGPGCICSRLHSPIRTGPAWWAMAPSSLCVSIRKACTPTVEILIVWWWGDKPFTVWSQSISGVSTDNPFAAFYDIHGRKGERSYSFIRYRTTHKAHYFKSYYVIRGQKD
jgi:hypothetical protein